MNKVRFSKVSYLLIIVLILATIFYISTIIGSPILFLFIISIIFLIPGRIEGYYFKEFYVGRRLFAKKQFVESIEQFNSFLRKIELQSWIKKLIWLSWGMYSKDIEAMTYNNLGSAMINLGRFNEAKDYLNKAIEVDKTYPIPYYNYAILYTINEDMLNSKKYFEEAKGLGFSLNSFDLFISEVSNLYSNIQAKK